MCGGKKSTPAPKPVVPVANPHAVSDISNDVVPGSKIAAATDGQSASTFGSELGSTTTPAAS